MEIFKNPWFWVVSVAIIIVICLIIYFYNTSVSAVETASNTAANSSFNPYSIATYTARNSGNQVANNINKINR